MNALQEEFKYSILILEVPWSHKWGLIPTASLPSLCTILNMSSAKSTPAKPLHEAQASLSAKKEAEPKKMNPYIISKRTPTQFNPRVSPIVNELSDSVYVAAGNLINVYSLTTNILVETLRSKRQQETGADPKKVKGDVHKGNIIVLALPKIPATQRIEENIINDPERPFQHQID